MTHHPIILLPLIPLVAGILLLPLVGRPGISRFLGTLSLGTTLAVALGLLLQIRDGSVLVTQSGGWPAPFGISLVFDALSGLLVCAAAMVALCSYLHAFSSLAPAVERRYFHPLMQLLMAGVNLSFLTGDLFNLFVAFEIMLLASYVLLVIGGSTKQLTQAYKYVLLNVLASTVFLMSAGMVYGMFGTLNMADLAAQVVAIEQDPARDLPAGFGAVAILLLLVFGLKGAFFPLWFWLPDTYHTVPIAIAGLFGGMLTKVGVYAVARLFPLIFATNGLPDAAAAPEIQVILAISAAFTMLLAVLGAVSQHEVRRILAVHVISQVGYMVFGIAVGVGVSKATGRIIDGHTIGTYALAGCVFYMIQHMVVKCALFLCCGIMEKHAGTDDLDKLGGLLRRDIPLAVLFFIAAMSLVGLPPLSGFFGKMPIIRAGFHEWWWLSIIGLITGALTLLSMLKIWSYGYWNPPIAPVAEAPEVVRRGNGWAYLGITLLVVSALFLGFGAELVYHYAFIAGQQLDDPTAYITAVLGPDAMPTTPLDTAAVDAAPTLEVPR